MPTMIAAQASYTFTPYDANLNITIPAPTRSYAWTPYDVTLTYTPYIEIIITATEIPIPAIEFTGSASPGVVTGGNVEAPSFTITGQTGAIGKEMVGPSASISASASNTLIGRAEIEIGADVTGHILNGSLLTSDSNEVPAITFAGQTGAKGEITILGGVLTANMLAGAVVTAEIIAPGIAVTGSISAGNVITGQIEVPAIVSVYGIGRLLAAPSITIIATASHAAGATYIGYATNIKNGSVTQYSSYDFDFLFRFDGEQYGVLGGQVYHLEGLDDAGTEIDSHIETPPMDFGTTNMKRMPYMNVGSKTDSPLNVEARVDESTTVSRVTTSLGRNRRARLSRGLKGRFWSAKVSNKDGEYMGVDNIELHPMKLRRKV